MGLQGIIEDYAGKRDWVVVQLDLSNAFNTLHRQAFLKEAAARAPAVYPFLAFAYSGAVPLYSGDSPLHSRTGTHQGCPMGPLGFALGIQPVIEEAAKGLLWSSWYLDDGLLVGTPSAVSAALYAVFHGG